MTQHASHPADTPLLQVDRVTARYGSVTAVDDVTFDIAEGEFFALLGPSGCGKTTLLRTIAGFESPASGDIRLDGSSLLGIAAHRRPVNLMFQSYALFGHLSVEKNIAYGLEAEGLPRAEILRRVADIMDVIGLNEFAKRRPAKLSGGQRQRVALARALVKQPRLLLLDEPLSALDRKVREEMQLELKRLQHEAGMTFVVVTHDQEEALSMADRIVVLNRGRLEQLDTPVSLYAQPSSRFVAAFIGTANLLDGEATATGVALPSIGELPVGHALAP
ncbi:ABC transporter ATP-binding protein, partial [Leucobacter soli]|uniref:ABC transporter ATP-binding protein n=1 Tax=Leucobacter soli TaxID=2812850 RepID=UPI00360D2011